MNKFLFNLLPSKKSPFVETINKDDIGEGVSHFPSNYILGLIKSLSVNPQINLLSYKDLCWPNDYEASKECGLKEWQKWKETMKSGGYSKDQIHLILQYDIDSHVYAAHQVMKLHHKLKSKCNTMIFNKRVNRLLFEKEGKVEFTPYTIDNKLLTKINQTGSCIGYHCNAAEASNFDYDQAEKTFRADVFSLRGRGFEIEHFSPHGGPRDRHGKSNNALPFLESITKELQLKWVHNKISPSFTHQYSDGGINNPNRNIDALSLRSFIKSMKLGSRYRILLHPQYYFPTNENNDIILCKNLEHLDWYKSVITNKTKPLRWWKKYWDSCITPS